MSLKAAVTSIRLYYYIVKALTFSHVDYEWIYSATMGADFEREEESEKENCVRKFG